MEERPGACPFPLFEILRREPLAPAARKLKRGGEEDEFLDLLGMSRGVEAGDVAAQARSHEHDRRSGLSDGALDDRKLSGNGEPLEISAIEARGFEIDSGFRELARKELRFARLRARREAVQIDDPH